MLLKFKIKNFKSIRDQVEFSMIAAQSLKDSPDRLVPLPRGKEAALRVSATYGANASGKSNFLSSLAHLITLVTHSTKLLGGEGGLPYTPFELDHESGQKPSEFELDFLVDNIRYRYGVIHDRNKVHEEWLIAYPKGQPVVWFERDASEEDPYYFGPSLRGQNRVTASLTRKDSLFLSVAAEKNHQMLDPVADAIRNQFRLTKPDQFRFRRVTASQFAKSESYRSRIVEFLAMADLGISDYVFKDVPSNELADRLNTELNKAFKDTIDRISKEYRAQIEMTPVFDSDAGELHFAHTTAHGQAEFLDPTHESRGTWMLFSYLPLILPALEEGGTLIIDELEASLHPKIASRIVEIFNSPKTNTKNAQLIFTTQSASLLRIGPMSRDQIWFTEKDHAGRSTLYPLTRFHARKGEQFENGYLQGRYGAIPYLGETYFLEGGDGENGEAA